MKTPHIDRHPHSQAFHEEVDRLREIYLHGNNKPHFDGHTIHDLLKLWEDVVVMCEDRELVTSSMYETLRKTALVSLATLQGQPNNMTRIPDLLDKMKATHDRKQMDYGTAAEPFENVLASRHLGINPIVGILLRMNDKVTRLKAFRDKGNLENESAEDSMLDIAVYAIIVAVLIKETWYTRVPGRPDWWIEERGES